VAVVAEEVEVLVAAEEAKDVEVVDLVEVDSEEEDLEEGEEEETEVVEVEEEDSVEEVEEETEAVEEEVVLVEEAEETEVDVGGAVEEVEALEASEEARRLLSNPIDILEYSLLAARRTSWLPATWFPETASTARNVSMLKTENKRLSTEFGILSDPNSLLQSCLVLS